jgi:putative pyruvate formate lyase activating enzyme
MICAPSTKPGTGRASVAAGRAREAHGALGDCRLCAHDCGVNRLAGELGLCRAGAEACFFSAQTEVADEMDLIPTFAVALSGCDLRCDFCITGDASWNPGAGERLAPADLAARAGEALQDGARTIMVLGGEPTIHLPAVLDLVSRLPDTAVLVWKTNAHGSARARAWLDGIFDIWLADLKFGNDACAQRLAKIPNYTQIVRENLEWANEHSRLIVRHLLMPGHVECCWRPVAAWLAAALPGVEVSLRTGYWPAWHAGRHAELRSQISQADETLAGQIARSYGIKLIP